MVTRRDFIKQGGMALAATALAATPLGRLMGKGALL